MKRIEAFLREVFEVGTPQCGLAFGLLGILLALTLLWLGFWRTLFICILCAAGVFVGGVKDKSQFCKDLLNKLLPGNKTNDKD